jgi:tetratricopeptide (TPR) repeat protein
MAEATPAARANAEGNQAYFRGKYEEALIKFEQSRTLASVSGDKQYEAIAMYSLARAQVKLCHLSEADRWFRASIAAREALPDEKNAMLTQNLVEYSRFLFAAGRPAEAIPLVERSIPLLVSIGIEQSDPVAFAELLEQEGNAQRTLGLDSEAALSRAAALYAANVDRVAKFKPEPYPKNCSLSQ